MPAGNDRIGLPLLLYLILPRPGFDLLGRLVSLLLVCFNDCLGSGLGTYTGLLSGSRTDSKRNVFSLPGTCGGSGIP